MVKFPQQIYDLTYGDISNISSVVISSVLNSLNPAVREGHGVGPGDDLGVAGLAGPEVGSAVLVLHSVLVGVRLRRLRGLIGGRGRSV